MADEFVAALLDRESILDVKLVATAREILVRDELHPLDLPPERRLRFNESRARFMTGWERWLLEAEDSVENWEALLDDALSVWWDGNRSIGTT